MNRTIPTLSVFTPAYNRARTIERTYQSLCRQTSKDFKWIIIDDGSTDNTKEIIEGWLNNDNGLVIEYYWKKNEGMASAHNVAYEHIDTELAVCIDSDDWMPDDGVEVIINRWRQDGGEDYSGMIGLDVFNDGHVVGTAFPKYLISCRSFDLKRKYGVVCDKKYVIRTAAIRQFLPYPIFTGEKNLEVNYVYHHMSTLQNFLCYNDVLCVVEYQTDGLTNNIMKQYIRSPKSYMFTRNEYMAFLPNIFDKIRHSIHYVSSAIFAGDLYYVRKASKKIMVILASPAGVLLNIYIRIKAK